MNPDDLFYVKFDVVEGEHVATGGWPRVEMIAQKWEENRRGERRFVAERRIWCFFDIDPLEYNGLGAGSPPVAGKTGTTAKAD